MSIGSPSSPSESKTPSDAARRSRISSTERAGGVDTPGTVPAGIATVAVVTDVPTLTLHELADGVWVWLQPGGESGVSNAGVIADDDGLTVVDTLIVRSQWEPFAAAVKKLGQPIRRLLLTHAHVDHVGGTTAFPNAAVFGSPQTSELL